jgi:competence protein ComEA
MSMATSGDKRPASEDGPPPSPAMPSGADLPDSLARRVSPGPPNVPAADLPAPNPAESADAPARGCSTDAPFRIIVPVRMPTPAPEPAKTSSAPTPVAPAAAREASALPPFWLRRGDQVFVALATAVALVLIFASWARLTGWGKHAVEVDRMPSARLEYQIDINRATWVEWSQLDGIGETLARRIVEDREQHGPFASVDDVLRVKGIGRQKLEAMRRHLTPGPQNDRPAEPQ